MIKAKATPSVDLLCRRFIYNHKTGVVIYRMSIRGKGKMFTEAGYLNRTGYRMIKVDHKYYLTHRIVWKMVNRVEAPDRIDHIDGDRLNNRIQNLREATTSQNGANAKLWNTNKSGIKGVHWRSSDQAWAAVITANKKNIRLGQFKKLEDAAAAIAAARIKYHGDFARAA